MNACEKCPNCKIQMTVVFDHIAKRTYMRCFWCQPGAVR